MQVEADGEAIAQFGIVRRAVLDGAIQAVLPAQISAIRRQKEPAAQGEAELAAIAFMAGFQPDAEIFLIASRLHRLGSGSDPRPQQGPGPPLGDKPR